MAGNLLEIQEPRGKAEKLYVNTENPAAEGRDKC